MALFQPYHHRNLAFLPANSHEKLLPLRKDAILSARWPGNGDNLQGSCLHLGFPQKRKLGSKLNIKHQPSQEESQQRSAQPPCDHHKAQETNSTCPMCSTVAWDWVSVGHKAEEGPMFLLQSNPSPGGERLRQLRKLLPPLLLPHVITSETEDPTVMQGGTRTASLFICDTATPPPTSNPPSLSQLICKPQIQVSGMLHA